jgi:starch phosphorylase
MPEFVGRVLVVENYDLRLARRLTAGVDVWLNNPVHPLEASGTSGMKAAMNGTINLSVLDGWWDEAYDASNGWAIKPASDRLNQDDRDQDEARTLYELLQDRVVPLFYDRDGLAYSTGWVAMAKHAMASVLPRFNAERMLNEYVQKFYGPAAARGRRYAANGCAGAREVASWKERVKAAWPNLSLRRLDAPPHRIVFGERMRVEVALALAGLSPGDVVVELLMHASRGSEEGPEQRLQFAAVGNAIDGEQRFALDLAPDFCGKLDYRIRAYPQHPMLTHPFELGLMKWV